MRKLDWLQSVACQFVIAGPARFENTKTLVAERLACDAIAVEHAGMRGQARQNGGGSIALRPVKDLGQRMPVRLLAQIRLLRLRAGDDYRIHAAAPKIFDAGVKVIEVFASAIAARNIGQRMKLEPYGNVSRGFVE